MRRLRIPWFGRSSGAALALGVTLAAAPVVADEQAEDQCLYNGIRLARLWPPRDLRLRPEPMPVPYLKDLPGVIPIDVGRQLFVDDFLVEETTLQRTYHMARFHPATPIVKPDRPWEQTSDSPTAMVFSDGVWYDPKDRLFKMWYMGGYVGGTCYATSRDGVRWDKPVLDVVSGTNIVLKTPRDSGTVWLDLAEPDTQRRYKLFIFAHPEGSGAITVHFSPDGIHWGKPVTRSGPCGDRTTVFHNPFRNVWVYGIRGSDSLGESGPQVRSRRYHEGPDAITAARWKPDEPVLWVGADGLDARRKDLDTQPQLYNLDCVAYESVLLGLFSIWRGQPRDRPKPNDIVLGYSRDGFHWYRPVREAFIPVSDRHGDWNWGNVQSAGGCCLIVGDTLYFYVSGRAGVLGSPTSGVCTTGLATLRRDGFASMDAGSSGGFLRTRPVRFTGKHLFINADASEGGLYGEVLDKDGQVIAPFSRENCRRMQADATLQRVEWKGADDLSRVAGRPVRFRFHVKNGRLFAFWVSPDASGASHGYVAAGGPGFTGPTDTLGSAGLRAGP